LGAWPSRKEIVGVYISNAAGLGGIYQQSRDLAGLGARSSEMELLQGCVGLGGVASLFF
jgi:hypothetical protein